MKPISGTKNMLVTGAAGFIGHHVCRHFLDRGWEVTGIDNFFSGTREKVAVLATHPRWTFYERDIRTLESSFLLENDITHIIHLAAIGKVRYSFDHPEETYDVNVRGTQNLIGKCDPLQIERFVFSSSSSVYGDQPKQPNEEGFVPNPLSPYAEQKLESERDLLMAWQTHGLKAVLLRLFNVFGPGQHTGDKYPAFIPSCLSLVKSGKNVPVFGDGQQVRDFTYIRNVVRAIDLAVNSSSPAVYGSPINVGTGTGTSVNQVIDKMTKLLKANAQKEFMPSFPEARVNIASLTRACSALGYFPEIQLEDGVQELIALQG